MKEKYCSLVRASYSFMRRATLPALLVIAALALNTTTANAQAPPGSLWYNGDFNFVNGVANERTTTGIQAAVYDDFSVTAPLGWSVTAVFSDDLVPVGQPPIPGAIGKSAPASPKETPAP
jgi:hypothetical protein